MTIARSSCLVIQKTWKSHILFINKIQYLGNVWPKIYLVQKGTYDNRYKKFKKVLWQNDTFWNPDGSYIFTCVLHKFQRQTEHFLLSRTHRKQSDCRSININISITVCHSEYQRRGLFHIWQLFILKT